MEDKNSSGKVHLHTPILVLISHTNVNSCFLSLDLAERRGGEIFTKKGDVYLSVRQMGGGQRVLFCLLLPNCL